MKRTTIDHLTEADWLQDRKRDITSTDCAALFDASPYCTKFELWHRKRDASLASSFVENERTQWGKRLEEAIALGAGEQMGIKVRPFKRYIRLEEERIGSSFDWIADDESCILECKNVDFRQFKSGWKEEDGELVAPAHIEIQVQHEMLVAGIDKAVICCFVGGNELRLLHRSADLAVQGAILSAAYRFWRSIDLGDAPTPTFPADADFIPKMLLNSAPGEIEAPDLTNSCEEYVSLSAKIKELTEQKEIMKAKMLIDIGTCEKARCGRFTISAKTVEEIEVPAHVRKAYRGFKVTEKKEKK